MEIVYKKLTGGCEKMKNHFFQLPFIAIFYAGLSSNYPKQLHTPKQSIDIPYNP